MFNNFFYMLDNQNKKECTFQITIIVLLAVIICFQIIHCIKLYEISYNTQIANMAVFNGDIDMALKKEVDLLKMEADRIGLDIDRKHMLLKEELIKKEPMLDEEIIDLKNNTYTLKTRVPINIKKKDINVELKDNIISINFAEISEIRNKNTEKSNLFSVYKSFSVPATKATKKDISYNVKDGLLTVNIPIIK